MQKLIVINIIRNWLCESIHENQLKIEFAKQHILHNSLENPYAFYDKFTIINIIHIINCLEFIQKKQSKQPKHCILLH